MVRSRILVIDPSVAGISGDMLVAAAIDLGANQKDTVNAMLSAKKHLKNCTKLEIKVRDVVKHGFKAKHVAVLAKETVHGRKAEEMLDAIKDTLSSIDISKGARDFALKSLKTLVEAEGRLHNERASKVHLHEAGSIDTIVDIVGAACALGDLDVFPDTRIFATPIAVGGGTFSFSHGRVPNPGPAILEIAKEQKLAIVGGPVETEIATPTGVAMLANLVDQSIKFYPAMKPVGVGLGAGTKDLEVPNLLRLTLGEQYSQLPLEEIAILETNLDDINGEHLAYASETLIEAGATDVSIIPTIAKKGRPGFLVRVISDLAKTEEIAEKLMMETGTLGVRITTSTRHIANREIVPISIELNGRKVSVSVKVSRNAKGEIIAVKPEYEEMRDVAKKLKIPLRRLAEEAVSAARSNAKV
ncbi:MAG: nickel pincer cofactor biosynthesis protein LarC [Thaumarchaeota archaeon]|nr:nickel pincer cofactor biosynthesis protein LarC [Nitrososphaerota archaeon]